MRRKLMLMRSWCWMRSWVQWSRIPSRSKRPWTTAGATIKLYKLSFTFYHFNGVSYQLSTSKSIFLHFTICMATQSSFQRTFLGPLNQLSNFFLNCLPFYYFHVARINFSNFYFIFLHTFSLTYTEVLNAPLDVRICGLFMCTYKLSKTPNLRERYSLFA